MNDRHHDSVLGICFSHDNRTMAAVSANGLVSITNLLTQSQMIVGQLPRGKEIKIGFDTEDYLIVKNENAPTNGRPLPMTKSKMVMPRKSWNFLFRTKIRK